MSRSRALPAALFTGLLLGASLPAQAATYTVSFCGRYDVSTLADSNGSLGDDFLTTGTWVAARGARIKVTRHSDSAVIHDAATSETTGCTSAMTLSSNQEYSVSVIADISIEGNTIEVRSSAGLLHAFGAYSLASPFVPSAAGSVTFTTGPGTANHPWNIAAAATQALKRHPLGLSGQTFEFRTQTCSSGGASCYNRNSGILDIAPLGQAGDTSKYAVVHEMGHRAAVLKNGGQNPENNDSAEEGNCWTNLAWNHSMNHKEFQSEAAWEGYAHFYAAAAFNDDGDSDCWFGYWHGVDWPLDRTYPPEPFAMNCEGSPEAGIFSYSYLEQKCDGTWTNRAVEYDYLRALWDMHTDEGISAEQLFDIWDESNPHSWVETSSTAKPRVRLQDAAWAISSIVGASWDDQADYNGIDH